MPTICHCGIDSRDCTYHREPLRLREITCGTPIRISELRVGMRLEFTGEYDGSPLCTVTGTGIMLKHYGTGQDTPGFTVRWDHEPANIALNGHVEWIESLYVHHCNAPHPCGCIKC